MKRTLFYDIKNFNYSEIANISITDLYFLTITGPHEQKKDSEEDVKKQKAALSEVSKLASRLGLNPK